MPELISELVWVPIGAKEDADMTLDHFRTPIYNGGMCATLQGTLRRNFPFNAYQQCHQRLYPLVLPVVSKSGDAPVVMLLRVGYNRTTWPSMLT